MFPYTRRGVTTVYDDRSHQKYRYRSVGVDRYYSLYAILNRGITLHTTAPWYGHSIGKTVVGYTLEDLLDKNLSTETADVDRKVSGPIINRESLVFNTKVDRYEPDPAAQIDFSYSKTVSSILLSV